jgi:O-antigen ligase
VSSLLLLGQFVAEAHLTGLPLSLASIETICSTTMRGHGGVNRFGTLALLLTMSAWYFTFLSRSLVLKSFGVVSLISAYIMCLGTGSRIASYGAPLAAIVAWASLRLLGRRSVKLPRFLLAAGSAFLALLMWWFVFSPESARNRMSDFFRLEAARCWFSIMFSGRNRFIWGVGYGSETPNRICYHIPDARGELGTIGHAHNTLAHIAGQHGMLGLVALFILLLIVGVGLRNQCRSIRLSLPLPLRTPLMPWAEVTLGLNLAILFNFLATTVHRSHQINQVLIGMLAASALSIPLPTDAGPSAPEEHQTMPARSEA